MGELTILHPPRLKRLPAPRAMRLTPRDLALVRAVARYRFLSSDQLAEMDGGSRQRVLRRLYHLFHHAYLDRPGAQVVHFINGSPHSLVYGLGRAGARLLSEHDGAEIGKLDWTAKNAQAGAVFIAHTIDTAAVMLAFGRACQGDGAPRLLDQHELVRFMPAASRGAREPFALRAEIMDGGKPLSLGVVPDRLFSLAFPDKTRLNFALELDRGTMPVKRRSLNGTSFARKVMTYWQAWKEKRHEERWGFRQFRVLTVAPSPERLRNLIDAQREITGGGSGLFLFATLEEVRDGDPLGMNWVTGKGVAAALFRE